MHAGCRDRCHDIAMLIKELSTLFYLGIEFPLIDKAVKITGPIDYKRLSLENFSEFVKIHEQKNKGYKGVCTALQFGADGSLERCWKTLAGDRKSCPKHYYVRLHLHRIYHQLTHDAFQAHLRIFVSLSFYNFDLDYNHAQRIANLLCSLFTGKQFQTLMVREGGACVQESDWFDASQPKILYKPPPKFVKNHRRYRIDSFDTKRFYKKQRRKYIISRTIIANLLFRNFYKKEKIILTSDLYVWSDQLYDFWLSKLVHAQEQALGPSQFATFQRRIPTLDDMMWEFCNQ